MASLFHLPRAAPISALAMFPGAKAYFYETATTTPKDVYTTSALSVAHAHPVVADAAGVFPEIWLDAGEIYKLTLNTAADVLIYTSDPVSEPREPFYDITDAEIAAGVTPVDYSKLPGHLYRYGTNTTPGTTDMTTALNNCYAACKAAVRVPMIIPAESQRFTSKLTWDGSVDVIGENSEFSILKKDGNFDGIEIDGAGQQSRYQDFFLDAVNDVAGDGIRVLSAAHLTMDRVSVYNQAGHGIELAGVSDTGVAAQYRNISTVNNGGDGFKVGANHFGSYFETIDARGNTGWGFNLITPAAYHVGKHIVCQQNVAGGAQIAGQQNVLELYCESNTGVDIYLTATSVRNLITDLHTDTQGDLEDLGTNNIVLGISSSPGIHTSILSRPKRTTNVAGLDVGVSGGAAGAGANPVQGGRVTISGGDSDGTGDVTGGVVELRGGSPTGTEREGPVVIQQGDGLTVIGAAAPTAVAAVLELISTTRGFVLPRMTTTQKNNIGSPVAGMKVYDTTLNKECIYTTAWETITSS